MTEDIESLSLTWVAEIVTKARVLCEYRIWPFHYPRGRMASW